MASLAPPPLSNASQNATPPSSPTNSTSSPPPSTTPSAPPPSTLTSPPPENTSPPPSPPAAPPPESPPPPSNTSSSSPPPTPSSQPPSPPTAPPPSTNSSTASPPLTPPPTSPGVLVSPPPPPPTGSPPPESPPTPVPPPANSSTPSPPPTSPPPPSRASSPENSPPTQPESPPPPPVATSPSPSNRSSPSTPPPSTNTSTNSSRPSVPLPAARPPPSRPAEEPTAGSTQPTQNTTSSTNSGGLSGTGVVAIGSIAGLLALSLVALAVWFTCRRKKRKEKYSLRYNVPSPFASSQGSGSSFLRSNGGSLSASNTNYMHSPDGGGGIASSRSWFSYHELYEVTNGFSEYNILGEGGFGCVYKGVLPDGREVAVKQLKAGSGQGEREFQAEVEIISRIHHRHLVSLVGYCISENQRLLVYDYVPNDTLHHHLHTPGKKVMDWASRVKVAAGAARGMAYLHEDCQPRIIHRDIKSTNILLENNFEARVADFGLAKIAQDLDIQTHVSTRVMGTFGYMAPEYASTGKLTDKSDVYSFGVVLLELITGRKSIDSSQPPGDESLVEWARPLLTEALDKEEFGDIVDPNLGGNFVPSEMFRMIEAAAACVRHLASKRPKMSQVARALDSMDELADLNNGVRPGESGIFNSREHSAQLRVFQRMAFGSQEYSSDFLDNSQSSWRS